MTARSWISPVVAFASLTWTGCVSWGNSLAPARPVPVPPEVVEIASPSKVTRFADVVRIPGQSVPLNGTEWATPAQLPSVASTPTPEETLSSKPSAIAPPADPALVAAMREIVAGRSGTDHLRQLDPASYELLVQLLPAVAKLAQTPPAQLDGKEAADILKQFDPTVAVLAKRAPLRVEKAVFCRDVRGYGKYEPLPERAAFQGGDLYVLYIEVGNVPNEPDGIDGYATRLSYAVQVKDDSGRAVELANRGRKGVETLVHNKVDISRSPVRDYYAVFKFSAPTKPGSYTVSFEVRDPATSRAVSRSLPFRVQ